MKIFSLAAVAITAFSINAFAAPVTVTCERKTDGDMIEEEVLTVVLDEKTLKVDINFFGKVETVVGTFTKVAKNGSLVYSAPDVDELIDQAELGMVFVDANLLKGGAGKIDFTARQLGDSEGSWWVRETFVCK